MTRSRPGAPPVTSLASSPSVLTTSAPSSGPNTVPMPPMIGASKRLDRDPRAIGDAGVDEQVILRIEAAGRRGERGGDRHGAELHHGRIDAERLGGILVFTHGDEIRAEAAVFDHADEDQRYADHAQNDPVERRAALELKGLGAQVQLDQRADTGAGDGRDAGDDAQHLGEGERDEREVRALQSGAEAQCADHGADQRARGNADDESEPRVDAVAHLHNGGDIGAGAEERRMAERILAAIAAEEIPALPGERDQQRHHQEIEHDVRRRDQRHGGEQRHGDQDRRVTLHARSPNNPLGRNSRTRMNITKMPIWPSDSPR